MTDEERLEVSLAALPKRESSRRKAKEAVKTRYATIDDDDEVKDIDLSDSDEDASWTPFKAKDRSGGGGSKKRLIDDDDDDDEDDDDDDDDVHYGSQSGFKKLAPSPVPAPALPVDESMLVSDPPPGLRLGAIESASSSTESSLL